MSGAIQENNQELIDLAATYFYRRNEPNVSWFHSIGAFQQIPVLRGLWPMSVHSGSSTLNDLSGGGAHLTQNNTPVMNIDGLVPYSTFVSANSEYAARADESRLDITGTESNVHSDIQGLTIGCWCWHDATGNTESIIGKWHSTGRSYLLYKDNTENIRFIMSNAGAVVEAEAISSATISLDKWLFLVGTFDPSNEAAVFVGEDSVLTKTADTTSIPASIFNSNAPFELGRSDSGNYMDGRISIAFLSASLLPDWYIEMLFLHTKAMYGHIQ